MKIVHTFIIGILLSTSALCMENTHPEAILNEQEIVDPLLFTMYDAYMRILNDPQATAQEKEEAVNEFSKALLSYHAHLNEYFIPAFPASPVSPLSRSNAEQNNFS